MTDRPILFSGPMVRALLDGRKTQTRRVVKPQPPAAAADVGVIGSHRRDSNGRWFWLDGDGADCAIVGEDFRCPYGVPGDRLYVRETWKPYSMFAGLKPRDIPESKVFYQADEAYAPSNTPWKPGIHMPRWASRLTLEIADVRVERLQDISDADAEAEGVREPSLGEWVETGLVDVRREDCNAVTAYALLWDKINGAGSWDLNPWVWAVSFKVEPRS